MTYVEDAGQPDMASHAVPPVELADQNAELAQLLEWHNAFRAENGRALRVLHVGNIAGNAYLNAKFLRTIGVEADVVCPDYDHVMGMPEWEDLELRHSHGEDFNPKFHPADLANYKRPDWFISGPFAICLETVRERFNLKTRQRKMLGVATLRRVEKFGKRALGSTAGNLLVMAVTRPRLFGYKACAAVLRKLSKAHSIGRSIPMFAARQLEKIQPPVYNSADALDPRIADAQERFKRCFPDRPDQLLSSDVAQYLAIAEDWAELFEPYDVVQCYATEPIRAMVTGKRPYVAFEHGTLRHFTMDDAPLHRMTALAYREADHTFVTNGDCLAYAKRLNIGSYSPVIHPIDVDQHRRDYSEDARRIREELDADVVIFCPVRHDYGIKGTDKAIQALPLIKAGTSKRVVMVLSNWGAQVDESRSMVEALGCLDNVVWRSSMSRVAMIKYIQAADVVFDQFVLPVFGSTAPQTIAAGRPVIASYVPVETEWLIPEPAPIVSAFTPQEIADQTLNCLDPDWLSDYRIRAKAWTDRYHSPNNVLISHLSVYRQILGVTPEVRVPERNLGTDQQSQTPEAS